MKTLHFSLFSQPNRGQDRPAFRRESQSYMGTISFKEGQRWISASEPELGLGTLVQIDGSRVSLLFPATGDLRQYAADNAPLKRVRFREGDRITTHDDQTLLVTNVTEQDGLLTYHAEEQPIPEAQLNDRISFNRPEDRLLNAHCDDLAAFALRRSCVEHRYHRQRADNRGFVGGRVDLIPHQLYIAHEISGRHAPRVLLSDEVGLGKTIEACLILHRLLVSGRAERILIVLPESLVHQWFVELLRKFNLWVNIFDEDRCESIERNQPGTNPFLDDQLVLCSTALVSESEKRRQQAIEASWDLLVVDEAHHLEWTPDNPSPAYQAIEALANHTEGLLLLTATPEQLGLEGHFARLRLLDPERYSDFERFTHQADHFARVATLAECLVSRQPLSPEQEKDLGDLLADLPQTDTTHPPETLLDELIDRHGPGRVIFRNTRAAIAGFPPREAHLVPLPPPSDDPDWIDHAATEFAADAGDESLHTFLSLDSDPRIKWLASQVQALSSAKILVICHSKEKALAIDDALRRQINAKTGVFHEDLPLVQRDRNAAWFAEEDGAQLLICSEIGSEGRNFQFAHHLVLFDLPLNPELVEQRIGRLDRIGQKHPIQIHVPFLEHSPQEVIALWYHQALNAFETNLEGGHQLFQRFSRRLHDFALEYPALDKQESAAELHRLLEESRTERVALFEKLHAGRDRLLELSSYREAPAGALIEHIRADDQSPVLENFMSTVFDHYGVHVEELAPRVVRLDAAGVITDAFPAIPKEGLVATYDRQRALSREDVGFLTWDHPIVTGAMDLVLSSELGNACFAIWPEQDAPAIWLDAYFELTAVAPGKWHADRFLPPTPLRCCLDHQLQPVDHESVPDIHSKCLKDAPPYRLLDNEEVKSELLPRMIREAENQAQLKAKEVIARSLAHMHDSLNHEIDRLTALAKSNDHVRPIELQLAQEQSKHLSEAISEASLRLDTVRIIWKTPDGP